jgi:hypothetical protein
LRKTKTNCQTKYYREQFFHIVGNVVVYGLLRV